MVRINVITSRQSPQLPPEAALIWDACAEFGYNPQYHPAHRLPDLSKTIQVRQEEEPPKSSIDKFKVAYDRNDPVPPVIMTAMGDDYLVDGRRRTLGMYGIPGASTIPAIVLDVRYSEAPDAEMNNLKLLALRANLTHGDKMQPGNIADVLLEAAPAESPKVLAATLHCSENLVYRVLRQRDAVNRASDLGIDVTDRTRVTTSHLAMLGSKGEAKLTNNVFAALLELVRDARLSTTEMRELLNEIEAEGTERGKLALIANAVKVNKVRIEGLADRPTGGSARVRRLYGQLKAAVGDNPRFAIDGNMETAGDFLKKINLMIQWLQEIAKEQATEMNARGVEIPKDDSSPVLRPFGKK